MKVLIILVVVALAIVGWIGVLNSMVPNPARRLDPYDPDDIKGE